jgi:hypothetical protein
MYVNTAFVQQFNKIQVRSKHIHVKVDKPLHG